MEYNLIEIENHFQIVERGNFMAKNYNTKQKTVIEEIIEIMADKHFTAEDILNEAKVQGKNIGLTTVYRHLDKMVAGGTLRKYIAEAGESACYQKAKNCGEHFHLKCTSCGKLFHLSCQKLNVLSQHIDNEHEFLIDAGKTVFYGLCKECDK